MAGNAPKPTTAEIIGGTYHVTPDTLQDGQADSLQLDATGNLKVVVSGGGGGGGNVNLVGINSIPPALTNPLPVELSDGTQAIGTVSNPIYTFDVANGSVGGEAGSFIVPIGGHKGSQYASVQLDSNNSLQVVLQQPASSPVPVTIQGASSAGGNVTTQDATPGTQFIFQEILMELRTMRKTLMLVYEESGEGDLSNDFIDNVNTPTKVDY